MNDRGHILLLLLILTTTPALTWGNAAISNERRALGIGGKNATGGKGRDNVGNDRTNRKGGCSVKCPDNSKLRKNASCPTDVGRNCVCSDGFEMKGSTCVHINRFHPNLSAFGQSVTRPYGTCRHLERDIVQALQFLADIIIEEETAVNPRECKADAVGVGSEAGTDSDSGDESGPREDVSRRLYVPEITANFDSFKKRKLQDIGEDSFETNVQVEGVDEADVVKSDGKHIFAPFLQEIFMIDLEGNVVDRVSFEGNRNELEVLALLLDTNSKTVTVIARTMLSTAVEVFSYQTGSLTRRTAFQIEGDYVAARSIKNKVHIVTSDHIGAYVTLRDSLSRCGLERRGLSADQFETWVFNRAKHLVQSLARDIVNGLGLNGEAPSNDICKSILRVSTMSDGDLKRIAPTANDARVLHKFARHDFTNRFVRLVTFDMAQSNLAQYALDVKMAGAFLPSRDFSVMSSKKMIFIAERGSRRIRDEGLSDSIWESHTSLVGFKFVKNKDKVIPTAATDLEGHVLDRFSMDLQGHVLRVGTETYRFNYMGKEKQVGDAMGVAGSVFPLVTKLRVSNGRGMDPIGQYKGPAHLGFSGGINPISRYRFDGEKCYLRYVETTENLLIILDVGPNNPMESSQTKTGLGLILNPIFDGNNKFLLGLGKDADGEFSIFLVDVTDPSNPRDIQNYAVLANTEFDDSNFFDVRKTVRYAPRSKKFVLPVSIDIYGEQNDLSGFLEFIVDPIEGIAPSRRVVHEMSRSPNLEARSLFLSGNLITFKGDTAKCTKIKESSQQDWTLDFDKLFS